MEAPQPDPDSTRKSDMIEASYWLSREMSLLGDVMEQGGARALVWTSADAMVVSRRDTHLRNFKMAVARMEREFSTPVFVRQTGGTAVRLGPGVVNVALMYRRPTGCAESLDDAYAELLRVVAASLDGLSFELGAVQDAYCDGAHNLVSRGLKIAGTAQRRTRRKFDAILVHGSLLVSVDLDAMVEQLNDFYATAGAPTQYRAEVCTTVERELTFLGSANIGGSTLVRAIHRRLQASAQQWALQRSIVDGASKPSEIPIPQEGRAHG